MEIWRDINGYEGYYQVSNIGKVRSISRKVTRKDGSLISKKGRVLKYKYVDGYKRVRLYKNGETLNAAVHRLVALSFIRNTNGCPMVNHKDENRLNNSVDNLEWCAQSYNLSYGTTQKRRINTYLKTINNRAIPIRQYNMRGDFIKEYPSIGDAAMRTGIKYSNIYAADKIGRHSGGFQWRRIDNERPLYKMKIYFGML